MGNIGNVAEINIPAESIVGKYVLSTDADAVTKGTYTFWFEIKGVPFDTVTGQVATDLKTAIKHQTFEAYHGDAEITLPDDEATADDIEVTLVQGVRIDVTVDDPQTDNAVALIPTPTVFQDVAKEVDPETLAVPAVFVETCR